MHAHCNRRFSLGQQVSHVAQAKRNVQRRSLGVGVNPKQGGALD